MNKYGARKTACKLGHLHDSMKEAYRCDDLSLMERARMINNLAFQVPFGLTVQSKRICTYKADFTYEENGKTIVEDVKGLKTPVYNLKKKLMKAIYGIDIRET